jgi:predicted glutamine amidotransferase
MCRLYGFRANEPTKVECTLVHSQNALMVQSRGDRAGHSHGHGWGVATYEDHEPHVERQAWAAYHGEHFRRAAANVYSETVLAHVRRATVGRHALVNTHPFVHGPWALVHNGTLSNFARVRPRLLAAMSDVHRQGILGETDSEHMFRYLLSLHEREPERSLLETLRAAVQQIVSWCTAAGPAPGLGVNVLLTDGRIIVGSRFGRTLFAVARDGVYDCEICGFPHIHHDPRVSYKAVVVASEPLTHESWQEVDEASVFEIDASGPAMHVEPL